MTILVRRTLSVMSCGNTFLTLSREAYYTSLETGCDPLETSYKQANVKKIVVREILNRVGFETIKEWFAGLS